MIRLSITSALALLSLSLSAATGDVIRTAAELAGATFDRVECGRIFELTGKLVIGCTPREEETFAFEDASGAMILRKEYTAWTNLTVAAGTRVHISGDINLGRRSRRTYARCNTLDILAPGTPPEPVPVSASEFLSGRFDCRLVRLRGVVRDIVTDEVDPKYRYIILNCDGESIAVPIPGNEGPRLEIGATVEVNGLCAPSDIVARRQIGRHLQPTSPIRVLHDPTTDPFQVPAVGDSARLRPQDTATIGRRRILGQVLATWHGDSAVIRTDDNRISRLETVDNRLPRPNEFIEAVGFPESDLYRINLSRVIWRPLPRPQATNDAPADVTAEDLQTDEAGRRRFNPFMHGRAIRLRGIVRTLPGGGNTDGHFNIESGAYIVPVDVSSTPDALDGISVGCKISVTGICIMESDNWRPNVPFPTIRGFTIVVRTPADLVILNRPPWWTPARLAMAIGALGIILVVSLVLNLLLKRLVEHRGAELAQSAVAKVESELKVFERTRLAVELHDSLSQYLTGISLAIRAAEKVIETDPADLRSNLSLASTSIDSCRQELRNCLWDLRNQTLDENDIDEAIRRTLSPHLGNARLTIRFNVPRERFSDNTTHVILHILRELTTNAIRHGHATHIMIAGSEEGEYLMFSAKDNGCGFDPESCPGIDQGHFGLQGIRERINQLEGTVSIASRPGSGTKVSVKLHIPQYHDC